MKKWSLYLESAPFDNFKNGITFWNRSRNLEDIVQNVKNQFQEYSRFCKKNCQVKKNLEFYGKNFVLDLKISFKIAFHITFYTFNAIWNIVWGYFWVRIELGSRNTSIILGWLQQNSYDKLILKLSRFYSIFVKRWPKSTLIILQQINKCEKDRKIVKSLKKLEKNCHEQL